MSTTPPQTQQSSAIAEILRLRSADPGFSGWCSRYLADPISRANDLPIRYPVLSAQTAGRQDVYLLAGAFRRVADQDGQDLGTALASAARHRDGPQRDSLQTRLLSLVRQPLPIALVSLRSLIACLDQLGCPLDWSDIVRAFTATSWSDPARHSRDCRRWAAGFHAPPPSHDHESGEEQ